MEIHFQLEKYAFLTSALLPVLGPSLSKTLGLRDVLSDMVLVFSTVTFRRIFDILFFFLARNTSRMIFVKAEPKQDNLQCNKNQTAHYEPVIKVMHQFSN